MVYPKQRFQARKAILEALNEHTSVETGIGYNMLFEKVRDKIGSRATFEKYLSQLQHECYVTKEDDPRHKKGVVIYRLKEASDFELLTLQLIDRLNDLFEDKNVRGIEYDENKFGKLAPFCRRNVEIIGNCVLLIHGTFTKMLPKVESKYGQNPFIKAFEQNGNIHFDFKKGQS